VHPAALNDRPFAALEAGTANTWRKSLASFGNWAACSSQHERISRLSPSNRVYRYAVTSSGSAGRPIMSSSSKSQTSIRCSFAAVVMLPRCQRPLRHTTDCIMDHPASTGKQWLSEWASGGGQLDANGGPVRVIWSVYDQWIVSYQIHWRSQITHTLLCLTVAVMSLQWPHLLSQRSRSPPNSPPWNRERHSASPDECRPRLMGQSPDVHGAIICESDKL